MTLPRVQLQLVGFSILYQSVTQQGGVGEQHILIIHSMYNQQSVWPAVIIILVLQCVGVSKAPLSVYLA